MDQGMDRKNSSIAISRWTHPYFLAGLVPAIFFLLFYFYPLMGIFVKSFFEDSLALSSSLDQLLSSKRLLGVLWFTFWQAAVSTILTLLCALPCAYIFSHFSFPGKKILMTLASIPFVLPAVVVATAFQTCFGKNAALGYHIHTPLVMILLAHVFYNFSVMLRIITNFWQSIQGRITQAAVTLGASPFQVFQYVTLPLLKPAILAAATLVFIFCFSSFGIILILGGPGISTIETEIYRQAAHLFNLPLASLLSLVQIIFTLSLMWVYTRFTRKTAHFTPEETTDSLPAPRTLTTKLMVGAAVAFILILCVMPLLVLAFKSFVLNGHFSIRFYVALFENPMDSIFYIPPAKALIYSLLFAGCALLMAIVTGLCACLFIRYCDRHFSGGWASFLDPVFMLPLSTSAVTLGFGIIITLDKPPLNLRTSFFLIPIAHALVGFPFVIRTLLPALRSIPKDLTDAAGTLGASYWNRFRLIEFPLVIKPVIAAAIFAFTISLGEFGATIFTARPETPTIPLAIYRFLGQPGEMNFGQALAVSTILMVITALSYLGIESLRAKKNEGF